MRLPSGLLRRGRVSHGPKKLWSETGLGSLCLIEKQRKAAMESAVRIHEVADDEIVEKLTSDDEQDYNWGWEQAYKKYRVDVLRSIKRNMPNSAVCDPLDILQDTFSTVRMQRKSLKKNKPLCAFIRLIAIRKCIDLARRERTQRKNLTTFLDELKGTGVGHGFAFAPSSRERLSILKAILIETIELSRIAERQLVGTLILEEFFPDWPQGEDGIGELRRLYKQRTENDVSWGQMKSFLQQFKKDVRTKVGKHAEFQEYLKNSDARKLRRRRQK